MIEKIERCVVEAMRDAYDWIAAKRLPKGQEVVLDVVNLMLDIERRAKKQAARDNRPAAPGWAKAAWQRNYVSSDPAERDGDLEQRQIELDEIERNGLEVREDYIRARLGIPLVYDDEIVLAQSIRDTFTALLPAKTRDKDWSLMQRVAEKRVGDSERKIASDLGVHHSAVSKMKSRQGRAAEIWNALQHLTDPVPATADAGVNVEIAA